jgi:hypothetical protein
MSTITFIYRPVNLYSVFHGKGLYDKVMGIREVLQILISMMKESELPKARFYSYAWDNDRNLIIRSTGSNLLFYRRNIGAFGKIRVYDSWGRPINIHVKLVDFVQEMVEEAITNVNVAYHHYTKHLILLQEFIKKNFSCHSSFSYEDMRRLRQLGLLLKGEVCMARKELKEYVDAYSKLESIVGEKGLDKLKWDLRIPKEHPTPVDAQLPSCVKSESVRTFVQKMVQAA